MTTDGAGLNLNDFQFLEEGMEFQYIVDKVGEPNRDIGSGVYLYQYDLTDGRKITLQFISLDSLASVWVEEVNDKRIKLIP